MKKSLLNIIQIIAFWGAFFLISLILGFRVQITGLVYDTITADIPLNILCGYLLVSVPIFLICFIINQTKLKKCFSLIDALIINLNMLVQTPYKGLDIREFFHFKEFLNDNRENKRAMRRVIAEDTALMIYRFIVMILWWFVLIFSYRLVSKKSECAIAKAFQSFTPEEMLLRVLIIAAIIVVLNIIGIISMKIASKKWREEL